jgi:beta-phosphoglucomutase-like phosphatase (HAD superfamily)
VNFLLFDMDGVVVETEHLKAAAHTAAAERFGGRIPADLYPTVMGQTHAQVRAAFIRASGHPTDPAAYTRVYREVYHAMLAAAPRLVPGVGELLKRLHAAGYLLGLVTSSSIQSAQMVLDMLVAAGVFSDDMFTAHVFAEDVSRGKPAPDPYLLGLERLGSRACVPSQCRALAFEDSNAGVQSAAAAGLPVIALRHRFNAQQDFSCAAAVLDTFTDTDAVYQMIEQSLRPI